MQCTRTCPSKRQEDEQEEENEKERKEEEDEGEEEGDEREHEGRKGESHEGGRENRCSCQSQDTIVDRGPLRREENKVTFSVYIYIYMRICASTYGTKKEEDIKRVLSVSKKGNEEHNATAAKVR